MRLSTSHQLRSLQFTSEDYSTRLFYPTSYRLCFFTSGEIMVAFGFSPGDVILCAQIAHQLYSSLTDGRKTAPCDLKELKGALFGLYCSLNHLHRVSQTILFRAERNPNQDAIFMRQDLGFMIRLCLQSLDELDQVTRKYQNAADDPPPLQYTAAGISFSTQFREQAKIHWRRFLWDLKRDSFCQYREKLQSHTDGINLLLNTFIWLILHLFF